MNGDALWTSLEGCTVLWMVSESGELCLAGSEGLHGGRETT